MSQASIAPDYAKPVVLFVEGALEAAYALAEIGRKNWGSLFAVINVKGLDTNDRVKLPKALAAFEQQRGQSQQHLGLWFDAETDRGARWNQLLAGLTKAGLPQPTAEGVLESGSPVSTSILFMPGTGTGCFETALLEACILKGHLACAESFLNCIPQLKDTEEWRSKVKIQGMWKAQLIGVGARQPDFPLKETFAFKQPSQQIWNHGHQALAPVHKYLKLLAETANPIP